MPTSWVSRALLLLGFLAMAWIGTGAIAAIAHTPKSELALTDSALDEASCNARNPLSSCFREPERGIPVGDLLVLEDTFWGRGSVCQTGAVQPCRQPRMCVTGRMSLPKGRRLTLDARQSLYLTI